MRYLPAEQDQHTSPENTSLPYQRPQRRSPIPASSNGSDNRDPQEQRTQRNPHDRRSRMLPSGNLPPLLRYDYRRRHGSTVLSPRLPVVRNPHKNHQRSRPTIHVALRKSTNQAARHQPKPVNSLPPTNGWIVRTEEPMGRTVSTTRHIDGTGNMERLAPTRNLDTQQSEKRDNTDKPKSGPHWV